MPPRNGRPSASTLEHDDNETLGRHDCRDRSQSHLRALLADRLPVAGDPTDREIILERALSIASAALDAVIAVAIEIGGGDSMGVAPRAYPYQERPEPSGPSIRPEERIAYRVEEVVGVAGVSRATVRRKLGREIEVRKVDGVLLLNPEDVHRTFGFKSELGVVPSAESLAEIEEWLK